MIGTGCTLGRAPRTKETLPDFREWCRVTRHPRVFRGLTGCQWTPRFWGITKLVIISAGLIELEEQKLLEILRKYKEAIAWSIEDLKGISPSICMHKILLEENAKTSIEHQIMLNSNERSSRKKKY